MAFALRAIVKIGHRMGDQHLSSRGRPCLRRLVMPLVAAEFAVVSIYHILKEGRRQAGGRRNISCRIINTAW
jgi:hypothetical protein